MAIDAGLTYASDPDWVYRLAPDKRRSVLGYMIARKDPALSLWASSLQASDIVHLAAKMAAMVKGPKKGGDMMDDILSQLG